MKNAVLEDIANYAKKRLLEAYGYCGAASGDNVAFLNSGNDAHSVTVEIKEVKEEGVSNE